jgi:hypothetical protein
MTVFGPKKMREMMENAILIAGSMENLRIIEMT